MSSKFTLFSLLFLFFGITTIKAQETIRCHTDEKMEHYFGKNPAYKKLLEKKHVHVPKAPLAKSSSITTIPVHVIIVHPPGQAVGTGANLSVPHIESQITVLNEDFRRTNADASNTPSVFSAVDTEIEFCLATVDPSGNPTNGITRFGTNQNLNSNEVSIKTATGWDNTQYLNIWVGPNLGGILGWAYLPSPGGIPSSNVDGVVVVTSSFGGPGFATGAPYDLGRTATHEVGHYLGLRHVWGNGGCVSDDGFADTPIQQGSNFGCPNHPSPSCSNGGDMFMNYMDYVNDDCMNAFSEDQSDYMNLILTTSRSALAASGATICASAVPLVATIVGQTDVSCFGAADGTITVQASGGTGVIEYILDGGPPQTSPTFTNVSGGSHIVTVQDEGGNAITLPIVIFEPPMIIPIVTNQVDVSCFGDANGLVSITATGGTPGQGTPYTYAIDGGGFMPLGLFPDLAAGPHLIEVQDGNGCVETQAVVIGSPSPLVLSVDESAGPTCAGDTDGFVQLGGIGGTPLYQYSDDQVNYSPQPIFSDLAPGDYTFYLLDNNNCAAELDVNIPDPDPVVLSVIGAGNVLCAGDSTGSIILSASGGTVDYEYSLDDITYQPAATFEDLPAGTYTLYVQDQNGCQDTETMEITAPAILGLSLTQQEDVDCFGDASGSIEVEASGGNSGYLYSIVGLTGTQSSGVFDGLAAGDYTVLVEDANACTEEISVSIEENDLLELDFIVEDEVECTDNDVGAISLTASGGAGAYTYSFDGGPFVSNPFFDNLTAGTYEGIVMDDQGCTETIEVMLGDAADILVEIIDNTDPTCFGDNTGSIAVDATGGAGGFSYTLDNETNATGIFNDLGAGNYEILVTDANNCTTTLDAEVLEPEAVGIGLEESTAPLCAGEAAGSLQVLGTGGTGGFSYELDGQTNTDGLFEGLAPGTYTVIATDNNNCEVEGEFTVEDGTPIEIATLEVEDTPCGDTEEGVVEALAQGGNGMFSYTLNGETNDTGLFEGLGSGVYDLLVEDAEGCTFQMDVTVNEGSDISLEAEVSEEIPCFGETGSVLVNATGGSGSYTFILDNETNTTGQFSGLTAGDYDVVVTDTDNCTSILGVTIEEPALLDGEITAQTPVSCNGEANGTIEIMGLGGDGTYSYTLNNQTNTTGIFTGLEASNQIVNITDGQGCETEIAIEITEPTPLDIIVNNSVPTDCASGASGSIEVEGQGGNQGYAYTLDNETNTTGIFENLEQGTYTVIVEDAEGCETSTEVTVEQTGSIDAEVLDLGMISCFGETNGTIEVMGIGGDGNYTYTLNSQSNTTGIFTGLEAMNQTMIVVDGEGCETEVTFEIMEPDPLEIIENSNESADCSTGILGSVSLAGQGGNQGYTYTIGNETNSTGLFENLGQGTYIATLVDAEGCETETEITIDQVGGIEAEVLNLEMIDCFGAANGSVELDATGGLGALTYTLGGQSNTTGVFTGLESGMQTIEISDDNNCETSITINIDEPDVLTLDLNAVTDIACFGDANGSVSLSAGGGTVDYLYLVDGEFNNSGTFENLLAGMYTAQVIDANNCLEEVSFSIEEPAELLLDIEAEDIACFGDANGSVDLSATGGTQDYTYELDGQVSNNGQFENLLAGTYPVQVTDANNCIVESTIVIDEPSALDGSMTQTDVPCFGADSGEIMATATGGTGPYFYILNGGQTNTSGIFQNLDAGDYIVTILDANNCEFDLVTTIEEGDALDVDLLASTNVACAGDATGMLQVEASGGSGGYSYTLQGQTNTTGIFENLEAGTYEVLATDVIGCEGFIYVSITQPEPFMGTVWDVVDDNGNGTGIISLFGSGGIPPYQYAIENEPFQTNQIFEGLPAGDYTLYILDQMGCLIELMATVGLTNSLEEVTALNHLVVFPNPYLEDLYLSLEIQEAISLDLNIYNVHGQLLAKQQKDLLAGEHQWRLPVGKDWPAATYFVELRAESFVRVLRVVKE